MEENVEELHRRIAELQKEVAYLNQQLKQDNQFGLHWIDVPEAFDAESENKIPVLEEVPELAIKNDDGKPTHILIEGDNYHALTCLNYTHHGKIDVIYIDPPYNTGSDGFTYKDSRFMEEYPDGTLVPKNHPLRHSAWLSFMEKRLRLAMQLLKDDGVLLVSINEEELANLKILLDQVFLSSNYITTFTIKVRHEDRILKGDKPIHETTEFLLMYSKSNSYKINKRVVDNSDPSEYKYEVKELTHNPEILKLGGKTVEVFKPGEYEIEKVPADFSHLKLINIRGSIKTGNSSGRFHMSYLEERNNLFNYLYKVPNMGDDGRGYRYFQARSNANKSNGFYYQGSPENREDIKEIPYPNFFDFEEEFNNVGTEGGVPFDGGKKPITFLEKIFEIAKGKKRGIRVVDFFAGSGSTGHAIIERNLYSKDNQMILVQMPELTYEVKNGVKVAKPNCKNVFNAGFENITQITYKRVQNVIQGYTNSKGKSVSGLGNSLKYYRTAFVGKNGPKTATDEDKLTLAKKAGCLLSLAENTLYETSVNDYYQFFTDGQGHSMCIYFQEDYSRFEEFRQKVIALESKQKTIYVFCWADGAEFASEFEFERNVEVKSIPQPILNIYKSLNA